MPTFLQRQSSLAVAAVAIFVAGLGAGAWRYTTTRDAIRAGLVATARRSAIAFDAAELRQLTGTRADLASPLYIRVKDRLARLLTIDPAIRFVHLLRVIPPANRVIFLADSEPADSGNLSLPGDDYPQAAFSPGLETLLATGRPTTAGPLSDRFGTWVTGYAGIGPPEAGAPFDLIGVDLAGAEWRRTLWTATLETASFVWILLLLPLTALVTTRRRLEQREALRNLTEAMEQSHSAVMIIDLGQHIEYANAGLCSQLGYTRRELIGREWLDLHAGTPPEIVADMTTTIRLGRSWAGEWIMSRKDGSVLPARGGVTPVKNRAGDIRSYVAVFEDMTEVRRTENILREAKERAEAGDRTKGHFLATMSHEVRTPLNGIVGFASLLLDTELTPEQQEYVDTIRTSSATLIQLTGDILDYARIESGRLKLEPQPCDARECVENALDLAAAAAEQKNLELLHWIDEGVPAAIIADVSRLRQVLVNLVNNAVKFTTVGEVEVRVRTLPAPPPAAPPRSGVAADPEAVLEFSVRDTGIGIAAEHHRKIFRPFSQVDDSTTRRYGGTGLGLAICKNIVELMHGAISFTSAPGQGSTFTFTIRVPTQADEHAAPPPRPLASQRLALVTPSPGLRAELARLATRLGGASVEVDLAALPDTPDWNLAIVDVNGPQALELATRRSPRPGLPPEKLIALVPIVLPGELRAALRAHFRLVLNKPLHHDMLASLLSSPSIPALAAPPAVAPAPAESSEQFDLRVLIVEDNPVNQRLIQKVVSKLGCRWTAASNGRLALTELARAAPDAVLMDLHMPELDGLSTINKIRAGEAGATVRDTWIIALTADAREEQRERTLAAGANDYLTKPIRLPEITAALRRLVEQRRRIG